MPLTKLSKEPSGRARSRTGAVGARDTDGMAVASFMFGLTGLLVGNLVLGPTAVALSTLALGRGTRRPGRAWFGMFLGFADIAVFATLLTVNDSVTWHL
ncbi:DUF4190 domain-containing protein [Streptomyces spongiae]|nr:DUF4190 domain-containing protein [Streptomyces spongiae]